MPIPLDIVFRGMDPSPSVEDAIRRQATRLALVAGRVQRCHVVVELPHRHHRHGGCFQVRIEVTVPGRTMIVSRGHEDAYVALNDAFRVARRQLLKPDYLAA